MIRPIGQNKGNQEDRGKGLSPGAAISAGGGMDSAGRRQLSTLSTKKGRQVGGPAAPESPALGEVRRMGVKLFSEVGEGQGAVVAHFLVGLVAQGAGFGFLHFGA